MGNVVSNVWAYRAAPWERVFRAQSAHVRTSPAPLARRPLERERDALGLCWSGGCARGEGAERLRVR